MALGSIAKVVPQAAMNRVSSTISAIVPRESLQTSFANRSLRLIVLMIVGVLAFAPNLLWGLLGFDEGMYAQIVRELNAGQSLTALSYEGEPYFNKPPLFFWVVSAFVHLFGESELAFRLPSVLACLALVLVTYRLGCQLFDATVGWWAGLALSTTYMMLWYGPRISFDAGTTLAMTFAVYAWVAAQQRAAPSWWYGLSFMSMTVGVMLKAVHALVLPLAVIVAWMWQQQDWRPLKARATWLGLGISVLVLSSYYAVWDPAYLQHYFFTEQIHRVFSLESLARYWGSRPLWWYAEMIWFDGFPWSLLLMPGLALMWKRHPFRDHPGEGLVVLWFGIVFGLLSLAQVKREPYLLPLTPVLALAAGYSIRAVMDGKEMSVVLRAGWRMMLATYGVIFLLLGAVSPYLFERMLNIPRDAFPDLAMMALVLVGLWMIVTAFLEERALGVTSLGLAAIGFLIFINGVVLPGIERHASAKPVMARLQALWQEPVPLIIVAPWGSLTEEMRYYGGQRLRQHVISDMDDLPEQWQNYPRIRVLVEADRLASFLERTSASVCRVDVLDRLAVNRTQWQVLELSIEHCASSAGAPPVPIAP
ncbi:MAG: glycosyltransferase family 39 protein [Nitrospirae bacterium]|nr:MAG: glycosyltransferase family 39 protein [Nitrospirota bacterium]